jgi:photosystem II stability/assembly factor-like uncharacterized protein
VGYTVSSLYNGSYFNIYKTVNAGQNWTAQNSGYTSMRFMDIYIFTNDTVFISGNEGKIIRTYNGGNNWITLPTGVTEQLWSLEFTDWNTGYSAGSAGRIIKTTNRGDNWFDLNSVIGTQLYDLEFLNANTGYVCGANVLYKTTNAGVNWVNMNFPYIPPVDFLRKIVFTDQNTCYVIADIGRVRKSANAGVNWTMLNTGTTEALMDVDFTNANTGYVCGYNGVIIKTTNAGVNWSSQVSGLSEILFGIDFTSNDIGYICSWSGKILKTTNGGMVYVSQISNEVPESFKLYQNYPNPFNPATIINYELRITSYVSLDVFDVSGKIVETIVKQNQNPGKYEVVFSGADYPSGVYFYKLITEGYSEAKKMILVK